MTTAVTISPWPLTQEGDEGHPVRTLQHLLRARGHSVTVDGDPGRALQADGDFGPLTDNAVRGFQDALGLTVDGIVGRRTWRALVSGMLAG